MGVSSRVRSWLREIAKRGQVKAGGNNDIRKKYRAGIEELEIRQVPSGAKLDLGTLTSAVGNGYDRFPLNAYSPTPGYGWADTTGIRAIDRGVGDALTRDYHELTSGTLLIDLPAGRYSVTAGLGDLYNARDNVAIYAEDRLMASGQTSAAGKFITSNFQVDVTDGQLALRFVDNGGLTSMLALGSLDVQRVAAGSNQLFGSTGPYQTTTEGATVTFAGVASGGTGLTYAWDFGDGGTATGTLTPRHAFADNGAYRVTLTVRNAAGQAATDSTLVTVNNVAPTAILRGATGAKEGTPTAISFSNQNDASSTDKAAGFLYSYDFDNDGAWDVADSTAASASYAFPDNGVRVVRGMIKDKDGAATNYSAAVLVTNVAPQATLGNNGPVAKGTAVTVAFTNQNDPSTADVAADFKYSYDFNNDGRFDVTDSTAASGSYVFNASGSYVVKGRIKDKDNAFVDYLTTVVVTNATGPTATFQNNGPVGEGSAVTLAFTNPSGTGLRYSYDFNNDGAWDVVDSANASANHTFADNGAYLVKGRVKDGAGLFTDYTTSVVVNNVAPQGTFTNNGPVTAGSPVTFSFTNPSDPSSPDVIVGFKYSYDFNNDGTWDVTDVTAASQAHTFANAGSYVVKGRIKDKDGGVTAYSTTVTVNAGASAPTATFANDGPKNEGSAVTLAFTNQTGTNLTYSYDFNNDGAWDVVDVAAASRTNTFADNGTYVVKGRIKNGAGLFTDYTTSVVVNNVAPQGTFANNGPVTAGSPVTFNFTNPSDPSSPDVTAGFKYTYDFNNDGTWDVTDVTAASQAHTFANAGSYVVKGRIKDKDGGLTDYSTTVTVNAGASAPTATFGNDGPKTEGSAVTLAFTNQTGTNLTYSYDFNNDGAWDVIDVAAASRTNTFADNGTYVVKGRIKNGAGLFTDYTTSVVVNNVAPQGTFTNNGPVTAGSPVTLSFANPSDPSSPDVTAGFKYSYDFNNDGTWDVTDVTAASQAHTFANAGSYVVKGRIKDKDGGLTDYSTTVTVNAGAPTATFGNDGPKSEGSAVTLAFIDQIAGSGTTLTYSYDFNNDGTWEVVDATTASRTHTFADNGTYVVKGRIKNGAGLFTDYTTSVVVNNVAPGGSFGGTLGTGGQATFNFANPSDPSATDTSAGFKYSYDFNNDGVWDVVDSSSPTASYVFGGGSGGGGGPIRPDLITKFGGQDFEQGRGIAFDQAGNAYVTGGTSSANYPTTSGAYDGSHNGSYDVFLTKISPAGTVVWSTLIGGPNYDRAYDVEVDPSGNVFVAGRAGSGFPTTTGALQRTFAGDNNVNSAYGAQDGFIAKFSSGGQLLASTFVGNADRSFIRSMAVDDVGAVYAALADVTSTYAYVTSGAFQTSLQGGTDGVVVKLSSALSSVTWGTYLGGNGNDSAGPTVSVGTDKKPVVVMETTSTNLPTPNGYDGTFNGSGDLFVVKFAADGRSMEWGTYLGGSGHDYTETHNLIVDGSGNVIVSSGTTSADFPTTAGAYKRSFGGVSDVFVTKFSPAGALIASTYLGGGAEDYVQGVATDRAGNVYVSGGTDGTFATTANAWQPNYAGGTGDGMLAKFSPDLSQLKYAGLFGGTLNDQLRSIAVFDDGSGTVRVGSAGQTENSNVSAINPISSTGSIFIVVTTMPDTGAPPPSGPFVVKGRIKDKDGGLVDYATTVMNGSPAPTATFGNDGPKNEGSAVTLAFTNPTGTNLTYSYDFNNDGTWDVVDATTASRTNTFADNGTYVVKGRIKNGAGLFSEYSTTITVTNVTPQATLGNNGPVTAGSAVTVSFTNPSDPSSTDTTAGFKYSYDFNNDGAWDVKDVTGASQAHTFATAGSYLVRGRIKDKDGAFTDYSTTVTVNAGAGAPTATFGNDGPRNEGSAVTLAFTNQVGTNLTYSYDFNNDGTWDVVDVATASRTNAFADNGTYVVKGRVKNGAGLFTDYTTSVVVTNVAPQATLGNNGPVTAGSAATISFTNPSDPSSTDTTAGFKYSYDFTNDGTWDVTDATAASQAHTFATAGSYVVKGRIKDKDGAFTDYTTTVTVNPPAGGGSTSATFVKVDSTTQGNWKGAYGTEGYSVAGSGVSLPSYAQVTYGSGSSTYLWADPTSDVRGLVKTGSTTERIAGMWYAPANYTIDVNFSDGASHPVALYFLDFNQWGYVEGVALVDGDTGATLDSRTVSDFSSGKYLVWNVRGHVRIQVTQNTTNLNANAFTSGLFIGQGSTGTPSGPSGTFGASGTLNEGSPVTFAFTNPNDPSGTGLRYSYDFNNDGTWDVVDSTNATATHTFVDNGTYAVKGRIKDGNGLFADYPISVVISNVAPQGTFTNNSPVTLGSPVTVTLANPTDPSSADVAAGFKYSYDFTTDQAWDIVDVAATSTTHVFAAAGTYVVRGRITDKDGGNTDFTTTVTVGNAGAPTASFSNDGPADEGSGVTFTFANPSTPSALYSFDFNNDGTWDVVDSTVATNTRVFADNGSYVVRGRIRNQAGLFSDYLTTVTVRNVVPTVNPGGPYAGNTGAAIGFAPTITDPSSADTTAGFTYAWTFGDGGTSTAQNPSRAYATAGTYNVGLTVTDKDGASNTGTTTVTVRVPGQNNPPIITGVTNRTVNEGQMFTIPFAVTEPDNDVVTRSVVHLFNGVPQANLPQRASYDAYNRVFSWHPWHDQAGSYTFRFTATDAFGASDVETITITVTDVPNKPMLGVRNANQEILELPATTFVTGPSVYLNPFVIDPEGDAVGLQLQNLPGATLQSAGAGNWHLMWDTTNASVGTYQPTLVATDALGNTTTLTFTMKINAGHGRGDIVTPTINGQDPHSFTFGPRFIAQGTLTLDRLRIRDYWSNDVRTAAGYRFRYLLDGQPISGVVTSTDVVSWDSRTVADGAHLLTIQLLDGPDLTGLRLLPTNLLVDNQAGALQGAQMVPVAGMNLDNAISAGNYDQSLSADWVFYPGAANHPHNNVHPYPYQFVPPANTLADPTVLHEAANWFVEPLTQLRSSFHDTDPRFYQTNEGHVVVSGFWPTSGVTTEEAHVHAESHDHFDGGRDDNSVCPYSTLVPNPSGPGWFGIDISGRLFRVDPDGSVLTIAGWVTPRDVLPFQNSGRDVPPELLYGHQKIVVGNFANNLVFSQPNDMVFDPRNPKIIYVADTGNNRIAKVDLTGATAVVTTYVGAGQPGYAEGTGAAAKFNGPYSVVAAADGTLYVADRWNSAIRKVTPSQVVTTLAGGSMNPPNLPPPPTLASQLGDRTAWTNYFAQADGLFTSATINYPQWMRLDSQGNVIIGETEGRAIRKLDLAAQRVQTIVRTPVGAAGEWISFDVDRRGNIGTVDDIYYATSRPGSGYSDMGIYNANIQRISANGAFVEDFLGDGAKNNPMDVNLFGHYPWIVTIDDQEGRMATLGFGSHGINSLRIAQSYDPPVHSADAAAFLRGYQIHRTGTVPGFPVDARPSFSYLHGMHGHSSMGGILHFDDLAALTDQQIADYVQSGMGGSVPRPEITGNDLRDYVYFIRKSAYQAGYTDIRPGADVTDVARPEVRNVVATQVDQKTIRITWQTDEPTLGYVEYGPSSQYALWSDVESSYSKDHAMLLRAWAPGVTYNFRVHSKDVAGSHGWSGNLTFLGSASGGSSPPIAATIVDNGTVGFSQFGSGWSNVASGVGGNARLAAAGGTPETAFWQLVNLPVGDFSVQMTWSPASSRSGQVRYVIYDGNTPLQTVVVDQKAAPTGQAVNGATYQTLASVHINSGTLRVVVQDQKDGDVLADAMRVLQL